ncbi:MAG: tetratricopeptide repeat protein [Planctomycetes bacterium]|nr:tetratricopeptide repeat protein [Planctomycetota bacterium]
MNDNDALDRARDHLSRPADGGIPSKRDLRAAIAACTEALRRNPDDVRALLDRGTALVILPSMDGRRARQAESDFDRAIQLEPGSPLAWGGRAAARFDRSKVEDLSGRKRIELLRTVVDDWSECLRILPGEPHNLSARAFALHDLALLVPEDRSALLGRAMEDLDRSLALLPVNGDVLVLRGTVRLARLPASGDLLPALEASLADYERALPLNPLRGNLHARMAAARAQAGALRFQRGKEAWGDFSRAVREIDSEHEHGPVFEDALDEISGLLASLSESHPGHPRLTPILSALHFARARAAEARGQDPRAELAAALRLCEDTLRLHPHDAGAYANYGQALAAAGRVEEGCRELEEALRIQPGLPGIRELIDRLRKNRRD